MSVAVVYWSGTGNTESMAKAVARGVERSGKKAELLEVHKAEALQIAECEAIALGCPSMGAEQLEEEEMEPFVEALEPLSSGKNMLLFGSYGWGDGEWMREWCERMRSAGANLIREEGIIVNDAPGEKELEACEEAGSELASWN